MTLPDPVTYYEGLKPAGLLAVSAIRRALSGPYGDYETGRFDVTLADADRSIRGVLASVPSRYWTQRTIVVRMISDAARREQETPRLLGAGVVVEPVFTGLQVLLRAQDFIGSQRWAASGFTVI